LTQEVKDAFTGKRQGLSGTEPVVRVYSEAGSEAELEKLSAAAKQWTFE
jgi:phosphomannomutase